MSSKPLVNKIGGKPVSRETRTISLAPLKLEEALAAAIATGPITDPKLKKPRKRLKKPK